MIDTSTTKGKIEMQQAYIDGKRIIAESYIDRSTIELKKEVEPTWSWNTVNYYIKTQTVEEAAYNYSQEVEPTSWHGKTLGWKLQEAVKFGAQWQKE